MNLKPGSLRLEPLTSAAFADFGGVIEAPSEPGGRSEYSDWLGGSGLCTGRPGMTPRLHVNRLAPVVLPRFIDTLERHPYSAQIFVPIDVASYIVVVALTGIDGAPHGESAQGFLVPGNLGIVYAPGVWHAGAAVLEREGSFAVLMWRNGSADDEEFAPLAHPLQILP
jgi:ureidoglycolate lyase